MVPKMFVIDEEKIFQLKRVWPQRASPASKELILFWVGGGGETGAA